MLAVHYDPVDGILIEHSNVIVNKQYCGCQVNLKATMLQLLGAIPDVDVILAL